ncbi:hypothetical protein G3I39_25015 [Streptomyces fulvissimus]|uniref:RapZ C-terminal domain-containing protein n=1 Tax=Streptomyces microflavus TaxID=1919 RepID=A0A6N9VBQ8_STRMI|nr:RNase adapter RapZ [Streptomyces microflavus]NEB70290.1 hypothetical protein [Streptomyces microflavus]NEE56467.1 hypothetical protein [Streptomyces sp. SID8455]
MNPTPEDLSTLYPENHISTVITSYGTGHNDPPTGEALLVDTRSLRNPPDDPAVRERMLHSNGLNPEVRRYVMNTPGATTIVTRNAEKALLLLANTEQWADKPLQRVDIHVLCGGGRHRSVAIAEEIAVHLRAAGIGCEVEHRHIDRPILPH